MRMLNDTIAVLDIKEEEQKKGSIIKVAKNPYQKGTVVAVPKEYEETLKVGEVVVFPTGSGEIYENGDVEYRYLSLRNLKAVI